MVENIGGIRSEAPGLQADRDRPAPRRPADPGRDLVREHPRRDRHRLDEAEAGTFTLDVTIPANTTRPSCLPAADAGDVTEGGHPLAQAEGVKLEGVRAGRTVLAVGSGHYAFVVEDQVSSNRGSDVPNPDSAVARAPPSP